MEPILTSPIIDGKYFVVIRNIHNEVVLETRDANRHNVVAVRNFQNNELGAISAFGLELAKQDKFILVQTSVACPEQYDVMYKGEVVAYMRLRGGTFSITYYPNPHSATSIRVVNFTDTYKGEFEDEEERDQFIADALNDLTEVMKLDKNPGYVYAADYPY